MYGRVCICTLCPVSLTCLFCHIVSGITLHQILSLKVFRSPRYSDYTLQACPESWLVVTDSQERFPPTSFTHCQNLSQGPGEVGLFLAGSNTEGVGSSSCVNGGVSSRTATGVHSAFVLCVLCSQGTCRSTLVLSQFSQLCRQKPVSGL